MAAAKKMVQFMEGSSWIRKMFEEGVRLKQIHGNENVYDFSLGNPNVPPPPVVNTQIMEVIKSDNPIMHSYMPNAGLMEARTAVAEYLNKELGTGFAASHVIATCGAAGALNIIFKALLDPGDEVLVPAPYFVEYAFYADNHGGKLKTVQTLQDFSLDVEAIEAALGPSSKIVLINSPNNPTGQIYSSASLKELGEVLTKKSGELGHTIYLVADEPYRKIVYEGACVPCIFDFYPNTIMATSYSKDLSLPGERIGFVAINPKAEACGQVFDAMTLANRILGFVNAPALMQRAIVNLQGICVDVDIYRRKRDLLIDALKRFGYELIVPPGAFYLFPRSPLPDDVQFVKLLQEENILVVPGSGFGGPGFFRAAYCVDDGTIQRSLPGFERAIKKAKSMLQEG